MGNITNIYHYLKDYKEAVKYYKRSLKIVSNVESRDKKIELTCLINMADSYIELFKTPESLLKRAKVIAEDIGDKGALVGYFSLLGKYSAAKNDFRKAIDYGKCALDLAEEINDKSAIVKNYAAIGVYYSWFGNYHKAIENLEKTKIIAEEIGDTLSIALCFGHIGIMYFLLKKYLLAYIFLSKAIQKYEIIGEKILDNEIRIKFHGTGISLYGIIVKACICLLKFSKAYEFVRRSKSKAFLELLSTSNIRLTIDNRKDLGDLIG